MNNSQYILISRQAGLFRQVNISANNVANVNTVGFKGDYDIYQRYPVETGSSLKGKPTKVDYVNDVGTYTNQEEGAFETTDNTLDVAIKGNGMFIVQSPLGIRFTRAGNFRLDSEGQLVTQQGYPVLGNDQQPITFQPEDKDIVIREDGTITVKQDGSTQPDERGQIGIAQFNPLLLRKSGNGLFEGAGQPALPEEGTFQLAQGMLEKSNVNPITEVTNLIEINRNATLATKSINDIHNLELRAIQTINKQ